MENKINTQFNKGLTHFKELKTDLVEAKRLMNSEDKMDKYTGASLLLSKYIQDYDTLTDYSKEHLNVDMNELEKLAVNILVNQGRSGLVKIDLLKKYGLYCGEGKK